MTETPLSLRYGLASIQGNRKTQEDAHRNVPELERPAKEKGKKKAAVLPFAFFGIYDGHGGDTASDYICQHLHLRFAECLSAGGSEESSNLEEQAALRDAILRVEKDWMEDASITKDCSGSTLAVVVIKDNTLLVANVGDSEVILCDAGKAITLTELHNPKRNPNEVERVKRDGGSIYRDRVAHPVINPAVMSIAVSRAIGDYGFKALEFTNGKPSGLTADPFMTSVSLKPTRHEFCIIACDGVWDVVNPQEAVEFVKQKLKDPSHTAEAIAKMLVDHAYDQGSMDNISATLVVFDWGVGTLLDSSGEGAGGRQDSTVESAGVPQAPATDGAGEKKDEGKGSVVTGKGN